MYTIADAYFEKGFAEGRAQGRARGRAQGEVDLLMRPLDNKFGDTPRWVRARFLGASSESCKRWGASLLHARSLDEVFGGAGDS